MALNKVMHVEVYSDGLSIAEKLSSPRILTAKLTAKFVDRDVLTRLIPTGQGATSFIKNDPPLAMVATDGIDRLVISGGGYPIKIGDAIVGGVGVSGGHYQDMEVAKTGLEAAG